MLLQEFLNKEGLIEQKGQQLFQNNWEICPQGKKMKIDAPKYLKMVMFACN